MKGWYWSREDRRLDHGDGRHIEVGVTHAVSGTPRLCRWGLHASWRVIDALLYARGPVVWRVQLGGIVWEGEDKAVATERTYLWGVEATDVLWTFARRCAWDVVHLWDAPAVVVRYLRTGDEALRADAYHAAWGAGTSTISSFAARAARAARDASGHVGIEAAFHAAFNARQCAASPATWGTANARQNRKLTAMVCAAPRIKEGA